MEHPFFKGAVTKFQAGDDTDIRHVLFETLFNCYTVVAHNGALAFRHNKAHNGPVIYGYIKDQLPPCNLSVTFPIPVKTVCKVVPIRIKLRVSKCYKIANQLEIEFAVKRKKPPVMAALMG